MNRTGNDCVKQKKPVSETYIARFYLYTECSYATLMTEKVPREEHKEQEKGMRGEKDKSVNISGTYGI